MSENITKLKVFVGGGESVQAASGELCERIKALVYEYAGRLPVASVLGVREIVKQEIIETER